MSAVHPEVLRQIDELQQRYIQALDGKDMQRWLATFSEAPESAYLCTTAESVQMNWPVALIMDDCRARLEDRVTFVTRVWTGTYRDYQTRHFVQRMRCAPGAAGYYDVESNFMVAYSSPDRAAAEILATGVYRDRIQADSGGARFVSKTAVTDTNVLPQYIVYPL